MAAAVPMIEEKNKLLVLFRQKMDVFMEHIYHRIMSFIVPDSTLQMHLWMKQKIHCKNLQSAQLVLRNYFL